MGQDLSDSSFYKALQVAEGILLILDSEAKPFSRIWCDYELYAAIMDPSMELDLITAGQGAAQMLSKNCLPQESAVAKSVREQNFPLSLLAPLPDSACSFFSDTFFFCVSSFSSSTSTQFACCSSRCQSPGAGVACPLRGGSSHGGRGQSEDPQCHGRKSCIAQPPQEDAGEELEAGPGPK